MILITIVIYKIKPEESPGFTFLLNCNSFYKNRFNLIIYDNSPESAKLSGIHENNNVRYFHDPENHGLARAYNYAISQANLYGYKWLLLLDQDTELNENFVSELFNTIIKVEDDTNIVAVIPKIISGNKIISPTWFNLLKWGKPFIFSGITDKNITAINSGSLIRIEFLNFLGGFNEIFNLDMLDYWFYSEVRRNNKRISVLNSVIAHDLSFMDYNEKVTVGRYKNYLEAEKLFFRDKSIIIQIYYKIRLFLRSIKQLFKLRNKTIWLLTIKQLF